MSEDRKLPVNFRLGARTQRALARLAARRRLGVSQLVREIVEVYVAREERRTWEAEARRAAEILAAEARKRTSSEASMLRILDANLKEFAREWVWEDERETR